MEDDFGAENLEDGELWLPSDFFSMDEVPDNRRSSHEPFRVEEFSNFFSALSFLDHRPHHNYCTFARPLPSILQPVVGDGSDNFTGGGALGSYGRGIGTGRTGCSPSCRYLHLNRVQSQDETFIGLRPWSLHIQEQRNRFGLSRVLPDVRRAGHGGTGVFLPRVFTNMPSATLPRNQNQRCSKKRHVRTHKREIQLPPRMILLNKRQQEDCFVAANS